MALSSHLDLLVLLLKDEAFDQLRTKQQLGYVVFLSSGIFASESRDKMGVEGRKRPGTFGACLVGGWLL